MKDQSQREKRLKYERAVILACEVCNYEIKEAYQEFLNAKKESHKGRDEAILKAKEEFHNE